MLGEQIGDVAGKVYGQRVLESEGGPKVETSFQAKGKILGMDGSMMGTYLAVTGLDGSLHGRGQGVLMTADGGMGTWIGQGVGWFTGKGTAVAYRGAIYVQSAHPKLARLNRVAALFEWDVDENDNTRGKMWEWK